MFKRNISYILMFIIVLFGFNMEVKALEVEGAQVGGSGSTDSFKELVCVYNGTIDSDAVILMQNNSGEVSIYKNTVIDVVDLNSIIDIVSERWEDDTATSFSSDSAYYDDNSKTFSACPNYYTRGLASEYKFYDDRESKLADGFFNRNFVLNGPLTFDRVLFSYSVTSDFNYGISGDYCSSKYLEDKNNPWLIDLDEDNYDNSCLYYHPENCGIIQFDFNSELLGFRVGYNQANGGKLEYDFSTFNYDYCPASIFVEQVSPGQIYYKIYLSQVNNNVEGFFKVRSLKDIEDIKLVVDEVKIETCEDLLSDELISYLNTGIKAVKIIVPLILIGLGVLDFAKGVFSSEDDMKKIQQKFIKRVILGVGFFLIPTVIQLLLNIASEIWGISNTFCGLQL